MNRMMRFLPVLAFAFAGAAVVQPATAVAPVAGYTGSAPSSIAGCPYLLWRLAKHDSGQVTGIIYYSDMSGASMASGTIDQAGHFQLVLTPSMGQGPVGTVTGARSRNGTTTATLKGEGCANMQLRMNPVTDLNKYHESAG